MSLIIKIYDATQSGELAQPFTVRDLKAWIVRSGIVKDNGEPYAVSSINAISSNSDIKNKPTTNRNTKRLRSEIDKEGACWYQFEITV